MINRPTFREYARYLFEPCQPRFHNHIIFRFCYSFIFRTDLFTNTPLFVAKDLISDMTDMKLRQNLLDQ